MNVDLDFTVETCDHVRDPNAIDAERTGCIFCNVWRGNVSLVCLCYPCMEESRKLLESYPYITYDVDKLSHLFAESKEQCRELVKGLVEAQMLMDATKRRNS